ncbi:MAG: hypothetical protein ACK4PR_02625 [Gammaproteobacteria bacterium]
MSKIKTFDELRNTVTALLNPESTVEGHYESGFFGKSKDLARYKVIENFCNELLQKHTNKQITEEQAFGQLYAFLSIYSLQIWAETYDVKKKAFSTQHPYGKKITDIQAMVESSALDEGIYHRAFSVLIDSFVANEMQRIFSNDAKFATFESNIKAHREPLTRMTRRLGVLLYLACQADKSSTRLALYNEYLKITEIIKQPNIHVVAKYMDKAQPLLQLMKNNYLLQENLAKSNYGSLDDLPKSAVKSMLRRYNEQIGFLLADWCKFIPANSTDLFVEQLAATQQVVTELKRSKQQWNLSPQKTKALIQDERRVEEAGDTSSEKAPQEVTELRIFRIITALNHHFELQMAWLESFKEAQKIRQIFKDTAIAFGNDFIRATTTDEGAKYQLALKDVNRLTNFVKTLRVGLMKVKDLAAEIKNAGKGQSLLDASNKTLASLNIMPFFHITDNI